MALLLAKRQAASMKLGDALRIDSNDQASCIDIQNYLIRQDFCVKISQRDKNYQIFVLKEE